MLHAMGWCGFCGLETQGDLTDESGAKYVTHDIQHAKCIDEHNRRKAAGLCVFCGTRPIGDGRSIDCGDDGCSGYQNY